MTTKLRTLSRNWTETVIDGSDFLLSLPSDSNMDVVVATTDTVQAPTSDHGHPVGYGLRNAITRELLGPGYVWAKASGVCNINLSTWSSDLAAILALGGLIGYWPTDPAYLYSDDAGVTPASVDGVVGYRANLVSGGPAAVQSTLANKPVLHKYSLSDFYWLETDDGSSTLTATTGDLGSSCTVAYANANGAVFTEGVTISSTYSTTPEVGYNGDFMIFDRALTSAEKTLITRHLTRDRDFVQRELLAISGLTGYWKNDPQYLFEDSAGTTPASTSGTGPVGQWLPVGMTLTTGPELLLDPSFDSPSGNWTASAPATISGGQFFGNTSTSASTGNTSVALSTTELYQLEIVVSSYISGSFYIRLGGTSTAISTASSGTIRYISAGHGTASNIVIATASFNGTIDSISLKKVTGITAFQTTTANKPILRKTPTTGVYWADSNTPTSALNVALGNLGSACTVARSSAEGVTFTEGVTISSTYNLAPAFGFNSDVAIFNRALTATEKALITRYMQRAVPMLGANLVTNGTFDTDTAWTKGTGWSIGSGVASKSAGTASNFTQSVGVSGAVYYAKADAVVTAGTIGAYPGSGTTQFGSTSATGTLAHAMKASGTGIGVRGDASFAGNVDNATIKEIL